MDIQGHSVSRIFGSVEISRRGTAVYNSDGLIFNISNISNISYITVNIRINLILPKKLESLGY